jgi:hypothetical protein
MDSRQGNLIGALDQIEKFLATNDELMGQVLPPPTRERFSALREQLVRHMKSQAGSGRVAKARTETKTQLRDELIDRHMRPIVMMARVEITTSPRPAAFRLPPRRSRFSGVVAAGYGLAEAVKEYEATFVAAGLRPGFVARLVAATDALRDISSARAQTTAARTGATAALVREGQRARRYLRLLDSILRSELAAGSVVLDEWAHVIRLATAAARAAASVEAPAETPAGGTNTDTDRDGRDGAPVGNGSTDQNKVAAAA